MNATIHHWPRRLIDDMRRATTDARGTPAADEPPLAECIRVCAEALDALLARRQYSGVPAGTITGLTTVSIYLQALAIRAASEAAERAPGLRAQARMLSAREAARERKWHRRAWRWAARVMP